MSSREVFACPLFPVFLSRSYLTYTYKYKNMCLCEPRKILFPCYFNIFKLPRPEEVTLRQQEKRNWEIVYEP